MNISTKGLGKRPRIAQAYAAMACDEGVQDFLEFTPELGGAAAAELDSASNLYIEGKRSQREEYKPLKVDNSDNLFFCRKVKNCKHQCTGVKGESKCLPCLEPGCIPAKSRLPEKTELCSICYTCELAEEPSV